MAEPVIVIPEPTRRSRKFEDNVTVIRILDPVEEKMAAALKYILSLPDPKQRIDDNKLQKAGQADDSTRLKGSDS